MDEGRRAEAIRWVALAVVVAALAIIAAGLTSRTAFGLSATEAVVLGTVPLVLSMVVALRVRRDGLTAGLHRLVFVQVLSSAVAAGLGVWMTDGRHVSVLLAVVVVLVYSGMVLTERQHLAVAATALVLSASGTAANGAVTPTTVTAIVVVGLIGGLTGFAAHLHAVELRAREAAATAARRSARALDAAVEGILHATSTDPDEIFDAVVGAAARLVDGPAALYALGDDGMAHTGASSGVPAGLDELVLPPASGLLGLILQTGRLQTMDAAAADDLGRMHRLLGLDTLIGAPIRVNGIVVGALMGGRPGTPEWSDEDRGAFALLAQHAGRALELSDEAAADRRMLTRLSELDRMKDDVVATVSHELRTPVTVITGLAETLARRQELDEGLRGELVQRLWANGVALSQIVDQLLDAALLQRGELHPTAHDVPVTRIVERTTTRLAPLISAHTVEVDVAVGTHVHADPMLIERVLDNVVLNALRHTPPGTTVRIEANPRGDEVELAVVDDGPGIAEADLDRVLERFERAGDPGTRSRGMGIGLALANEILRAHGSCMEVSSRPGEGARFAFVLPAAAHVRGSTPSDAPPSVS